MAEEGKKAVNIRLATLRWKSVWIPAVVVLSCWAPLSRADEAGQKAVAETRQALRQEGFKTDLADFDLSTSPEQRAREAILKEAVEEPAPTITNEDLPDAPRHWSHRPYRPSPISLNEDSPDLMEAVESNSAAVVWRLASPGKPVRRGPSLVPLYSWDDFRKALDAKGPRLDRACAAIFAGPIRFDLRRKASGSYREPPLNQIKGLMRSLDNRLVLALRDGNPAAAWTNLLAATRLVTAREPEPLQKCHLARFKATELAFGATWQALQTNGWPDAQLARLQAEWEPVDFFTGLPDTAAYGRASEAAFFQRERLMPRPAAPFGEFMAWALRFPVMVWEMQNEEWRHEQYLQHGSYVDEAAMLHHYRDAEVELRRAVSAPTWSEMGRMPRVLRPYPINAQTIKDLLGHAAVAEAQRRIIIAALALERYRARHGTYPQSLSGLVPEFLRKPPTDFMDGQPLRYRLSEDGHFIIYSVGLDCADNGGRWPPHDRPGPFGDRLDGLSSSVIVWPLPASLAAVDR